MADGRLWRVLGGVLVPVAVAGLAGCSGGGGSSAPATSASAAAFGMFSVTQLRGALLTRVNGVPAVTTARTGKYASLSSASTGRPAASAVRVSPSACAGAVAAAGLGSTILAEAPAAAVTFRVGGNAVSEVLIASSAGSASAVLAGRVPAECAQYRGKVAGKTVKYGLTDKAITGIGQQARVLNVRTGVAADNQWSLIYRGAGFIGTVTVIGPNASELAARELAQQAYAFAAKSLA
jgi:hypothetical protein